MVTQRPAPQNKFDLEEHLCNLQEDFRQELNTLLNDWQIRWWHCGPEGRHYGRSPDKFISELLLEYSKILSDLQQHEEDIFARDLHHDV